MKSKEYPDLTWVTPAAYESGRPYGRPLWIVVHTTEGSEGLRSAEDGAAYDARREDGTSTHYFHDQDSTIQCVLTSNRANAARGTGNSFGIHHELCGRAAQNAAQWHDPASAGALRQFAKQAARDAAKWGIPIKLLTVAEVRAKKSGFCEHNTISQAFGESDHSDPGKNYPWSEVLAMVRAGGEDDMEISELNAELRKDSPLAGVSKAIPWQYVGGGIPAGMSTLSVLNAIHGYSKATVDLVKIIADRDEVDEVVLGQQVAAALAPAVAAQVGNVLAGLVEQGVTLTPEQVSAAVEAGVREVLREGVDE